MTNQVREVADLHGKVEKLSDDVHELKDSVSELVEAWRTANGLVKFTKWVAGIASAVAIIYGVVTGRVPAP